MPARSGSPSAAFDGARWADSLPPDSTGTFILAGLPLNDLSAASAEIAGCIAGEADGYSDTPVQSEGGATATRLSSGRVLVRAECPLDPGTGAYGGYFALAVVSDQGIRLTDFVTVSEETHALTQEGTVAHGLDALDDLDQGVVHVLYKYRGAGGCGQFVTYRLSEDGRMLAAETVREQTCDSGPPDHVALPDAVILNGTCDGEPCYDPKLWGVVWRRDG